MKTINFLKMQALGNDFVILDGRNADLGLNNARIRNLTDRRLGVGCDQLIVLESSKNADIFMRIYNADGTQAGACGNATRCVADIILKENNANDISIETISGILGATRVDAKTITIDMGPPKLEWKQIPLASSCDTLHVPLSVGNFSDPVAVNMGNPHAVFFVTDVEKQPVDISGRLMEKHPIFPERANIEFAEVRSRDEIRMRVWERGAGITQACGSGACATAVAAIRRDLTNRKVKIVMDGGPLEIEWRETDGHVLMTGGYEYVFIGQYFI